MEYMCKGRMNRDDLVILNVSGPDTDWADDLCALAYNKGICVFAPDYEGTTDGKDGINVLIPNEDMPTWQHSATEMGLTSWLADLPVKNGRYGDGCWPGVMIVSEAEDSDTVYWIEL